MSVPVGTGVGLVVKYLLDKRYIFRYQARDFGDDSRTFFIYTIMGVLATAILWGFEFTLEAIFHDKIMRCLGGNFGLAIGYIAKYHLDKQFVLKQTTDTARTGNSKFSVQDNPVGKARRGTAGRDPPSGGLVSAR